MGHLLDWKRSALAHSRHRQRWRQGSTDVSRGFSRQTTHSGWEEEEGRKGGRGWDGEGSKSV